MARDIFLEEYFKNSVHSALSKDYTFDSPRDDELMAKIVTKWDWIVGVWEDRESPNGFRMLSISGFDKVQTTDNPTVSGNSFLIKDEATALKWQAIHGDSSWTH